MIIEAKKVVIDAIQALTPLMTGIYPLDVQEEARLKVVELIKLL